MVYMFGLFVSIFFVLFLKLKRTNYIVTFEKEKLCISRYFMGFILAMLPLTIISAIRYDVGTDYFGTYVNGFEIIKNGYSIRDVGFGIISKFVLFFTNDYAGLFIVTSFFIGIFVYLSIFEQSESIVFSIILYVVTCQFFISMNMIRQSLATAIFLYSIKFLQNKKYLKYSILILFATSIHTSAIIYFGLLFYELVFRWRKQLLVAGVLFLVFSDKFVDFIIYIISRIPYLKRYFYWYFNSSYNEGSFNIISFLVQLTILIFIVIIYENNKDEKMKLYLVLQICSVLCLTLSKFMPLTQRLSYLFSFANIIYIPNSIKLIRNKKNKLLFTIVVIISFFAYMWITIFVRGYQEVLPYKTIFSR